MNVLFLCTPNTADGVGQPHGSDELSSAVAMDSANPKSPPHIESEKQQNEYGNWHGNHSFKVCVCVCVCVCVSVCV